MVVIMVVVCAAPQTSDLLLYCSYSTGAFGIWPENWVDGGGLGITIRNEPRETVLTSIAISGKGVGNAAP
eukprot:COSAG05_NODE_478_length_9434_cov_5.178897_2_plen_70_part_00